MRALCCKLRDDLLNGETFCSLKEAQIVIEQWRKHYNAASYCPSLYVIDTNRSGFGFCCPAGAVRRLRTRSTRRLTASPSRAERLKSHGPSLIGLQSNSERRPVRPPLRNRFRRAACLGLRPFGQRSFPQDLRSVIERNQLGDVPWQLLVASDHQIALRSQPFQHVR